MHREDIVDPFIIGCLAVSGVIAVAQSRWAHTIAGHVLDALFGPGGPTILIAAGIGWVLLLGGVLAALRVLSVRSSRHPTHRRRRQR